MSEKRFTWKTEKLQHSDDEVLLVVDNENKDWKGHILNIVDLLNEQQSTITHLEKVNGKNFAKRRLLERDNLVLRNENEQLKEELNNLKKDETMLYHYYTLARYGGDGV